MMFGLGRKRISISGTVINEEFRAAALQLDAHLSDKYRTREYNRDPDMVWVNEGNRYFAAAYNDGLGAALSRAKGVLRETEGYVNTARVDTPESVRREIAQGVVDYCANKPD